MLLGPSACPLSPRPAQLGCRRESIGAYSVKDAWQLKQLLEALQAAKEAKTAQTSPPASSPMETAATS